MGENSKIEWTDHTFNPWMGCAKVSEGCKHCYAESLDKRYGRSNWGPDATRTRTSADNWKNPIKWNKRAEKLGIRYRVFCASLADVFERHQNPEISRDMAEWRTELFQLMEATPHLDWLVLTKRPGNVMFMVPGTWHTQWPSNVWIGATIENQNEDRIRQLISVPAPIRFVSYEPAVGPLTLKNYLGDHSHKQVVGQSHELRGIQWVICGGESGPGARPMNPEWARNIRDECKAAGVPYLFKQWGEWAPGGMTKADWPLGEDGFHHVMPTEVPGGNRHIMIKHGKRINGRLLDGVEHSEFPKP